MLRKIARGRVNRVENRKPFHAKTEAVPWENRKPFHGKSGSCSWENRKPCTRTYGRHRADRTDGAVATVRTPPCQPCLSWHPRSLESLDGFPMERLTVSPWNGCRFPHGTVAGFLRNRADRTVAAESNLRTPPCRPYGRRRGDRADAAVPTLRTRTNRSMRKPGTVP